MLGQFIISLYTRQLSTPKDIYCHAFLYFQNLLQHLSCWRQPQILKVLAVTITSYEVTINMKLVTTTIISIFQTQVWRSQKNWCQCQTSHWQSYSLNIRILTPNTILFLLTQVRPVCGTTHLPGPPQCLGYSLLGLGTPACSWVMHLTPTPGNHMQGLS